jgi:transposase
VERDQGRLREWIVRKRLQGLSVTEICASAQISRDMFYRWWNRYQAEGRNGLEGRPKGRPKSSMVDDSVKKKVVRLRQRYGWGPNKIAGYFNHEGFAVDHNMVCRVICEADLNHPVDKPRKTWGTKRFQREHSSSLWQADYKLCSDDYWMISFQDDHSRFITGSVKVWDPTGENAIQPLEMAVKRYGAPERAR